MKQPILDDDTVRRIRRGKRRWHSQRGLKLKPAERPTILKRGPLFTPPNRWKPQRHMDEHDLAHLAEILEPIPDDERGLSARVARWLLSEATGWRNSLRFMLDCYRCPRCANPGQPSQAHPWICVQCSNHIYLGWPDLIGGTSPEPLSTEAGRQIVQQKKKKGNS